MIQTTLKALAEPNRFNIMELLIEGPHAVGEIVVELDLSQPLVSKHLAVLSQAGLVSMHQLAQQRIYEIQPKPIKELDRWLHNYKKLWEARFDRLEKVLSEEMNKSRRSKHGKRTYGSSNHHHKNF